MQSPDLPKKLYVEASASTVASSSRVDPLDNQDTYFIAPNYDIAAVFDGIGGDEAGGRAARVAAHTISTLYREQPKPADHAESRRLANFFEQCQSDISNDPDARDSGTTGTIASVYYTADRQLSAAVASVGDSRAYLYRHRQPLVCLSRDDAILIKATGEFIDPYEPTNDLIYRRYQDRFDGVENENDLVDSIMRASAPHRHKITDNLGKGRNGWSFRHFEQPLQSGDALVLTTDGIHDNLTSKEMQRILSIATYRELLARGQQTMSFAECAASALVYAARTRSGQDHFRAKNDDMTAVVMRVQEA